MIPMAAVVVSSNDDAVDSRTCPHCGQSGGRIALYPAGFVHNPGYQSTGFWLQCPRCGWAQGVVMSRDDKLLDCGQSFLGIDRNGAGLDWTYLKAGSRLALSIAKKTFTIREQKP